MRIEGLRKYQRRHPKECYFLHLPVPLRGRARHWLKELLRRRSPRGQSTPDWCFAILVGQAKRLALNRPTSEWGRSMFGKRGGYAVQRRYRAEGRNPLRDARGKLEPAQSRPAQPAPAPFGVSLSPSKPPLKGPRPASIPVLPPPPSLEARMLHKTFDPPDCRCYYCAYPNHER